MTTYFTADQHLGHTDIIEYENRPFDNADIMDKWLIANHNKVVEPDDLVYHLGDVSMHNKERTAAIIAALNGTHVLIRGNHDKTSRWMMSCGFAACLESGIVKLGRHHCLLIHNPPCTQDIPRWTIHGHVHSKWKVQEDKKRICVSVENWSYSPVAEIELISIMDKHDT